MTTDQVLCLSIKCYQLRVLINKSLSIYCLSMIVGKRGQGMRWCKCAKNDLHVCVCQWHNGKCVCVSVCVCVCVCVCVSFLLLPCKLSLRCLFSQHYINQGGVQKVSKKSLFTGPTLLKNLSGDAQQPGLVSKTKACRLKIEISAGF